MAGLTRQEFFKIKSYFKRKAERLKEKISLGRAFCKQLIFKFFIFTFGMR
jgi:hypothetical protein